MNYLREKDEVEVEEHLNRETQCFLKADIAMESLYPGLLSERWSVLAKYLERRWQGEFQS